MRLPTRGLRRLRADATRDEGITLLEVVVSLLIIAVVMSAAAGFFINGLRQTGGQSSRQQAVVITDQWLERVNALAPASLLTGRTLTSVTALLATDTGGVLTGRDDTSNTTSALDYDPNAANAPSIAIPTSQTVAVNKQTYLVRIFIDPCWLPTGTASSTNATRNLACVSTSAAARAVTGATGSTAELRATVATSWTGVIGTNCAGGCQFNASTIVDPNGDATFNSNISSPTLSSTSPTTVGGNASRTITLNGTGFQNGATVSATCSTCTVTVGTINQSTNTGTSIQVPITLGPAAGQILFRLTNPDGGTATISMTVTAGPAVTSYTPSFVGANVATTVSLTGTGLVATPTVTATGGTVGAVSYSSGTLTFTYTGSSGTPSPVFTVTNPDGGATTVSGIAVVGGPVVVSFTPVTARYVMLNITQFGPTNSTQPGTYYAQLAEMQVFASASSSTNLALGRTVTSNEPDNYVSYGWSRALLTDGVTDTNNQSAHGWTTTGISSQTPSPASYVVIDLGSVQTVGSVTLWGRTDVISTTGGTASFPAHFTVQTSSTSATAGFTTVSSS